MATRVLVADQNELVAAALGTWLSQTAEIQVVHPVVGSGEEVLRAVRAHEPDVLVLEALLENPSGLVVVRQLAGTDGPTRPLVISQAEQAWLARAMLDAGAWGYLLKRDAPDFVAEAVRGVAQGKDGWMSPNVAKTLASDQDSLGRSLRQLTPREREVLRLVTEGLRNPEIAERLHISPGTVKNHVHHILQKLEMPSRLKLIVWAHRHDLPQLPPGELD
jgi:RNA polymerase sigma factor (sigma-70 family)